MTPAAAASRPHSLIGGECGHEAALHGYEALAPGAPSSRTDRDPVRNEPFVIHLTPVGLQQAIKAITRLVQGSGLIPVLAQTPGRDLSYTKGSVQRPELNLWFIV